MTGAKSPGAVAELGASEQIDQLGGKVDPENSLRVLTAQALPLRAGNATRCLVCGSTVNPRRASRRQKYCSYRCRDEARRARNFAASGATRTPGPVRTIGRSSKLPAGPSVLAIWRSDRRPRA